MLNNRQFAVLAVLIAVAPNISFGQINQNPYEATNDFTGASLDLRLYNDPGSYQRLNLISSQPLSTGNDNIFLTTQEGRVFEIADNGAAQGVSPQFFDYDAAVTERFGAAATDGFTTSGPNGELFVTSKQTGNVYIATNAISSQIATITAIPEPGTGLLPCDRHGTSCRNATPVLVVHSPHHQC